MLRRWLPGLVVVSLVGTVGPMQSGAGDYEGQVAKIFLLEDDGKYGAATLGWTALMRDIQGKAGNDPKMKPLYFDVYFHGTRAMFLWAIHDPKVKDREAAVNAAGKRIVDLELSKSKEGWEMTNERFNKLLKAEPMLKQAYDRVKTKRLDAK